MPDSARWRSARPGIGGSARPRTCSPPASPATAAFAKRLAPSTGSGARSLAGGSGCASNRESPRRTGKACPRVKSPGAWMAVTSTQLSGSVFVDRAHGVDSTQPRTSASIPGHEMRIDAMRHQNSVFHSVLKHVPWPAFDQLVEAHEADARVRRLTTKSQFVAMLYGQLSGATSLREIVTGLASHAVRLYHFGTASAPRSTLSDADAQRPATVFSELLARMMKQARRGLRRSLAETTYLIDSTWLRLDDRSMQWARFSAGICRAKVHVIYDPDRDRPIYAGITPPRLHDITAAQGMPIEPGATYVFDLGYYDYAWWAKLDAAQCRIVTRLKSNTPLAVVEELPVAEGSNILSDRIGFLPARQAKSRRNPMQDAVREVRVVTDTGK